MGDAARRSAARRSQRQRRQLVEELESEKAARGIRADGADLSKVAVKPGDVIVLFGTGFGATNPASPIGQIIPAAPLANSMTVRVGGSVAATQFTGIVGAGLYQFNVVVPAVPNGDNAVLMEIGGASTQPNVFLTVQR